MRTYKMHLIRTGRTWEQPPKPYVGQSDPPLCVSGRQELLALQQDHRYPRVEMVFTSPLARCVETADLLYPDTYTQELPALMDLHLGAFQGKTFEELRGDAGFARWLDNSAENTPAGGEAADDFVRRIVGAVHTIFQRMMEQRMGSVAVVTHGGVIMTLLAAVGLPKHPVYQWAVEGGHGYTLLFTPQMWMRDGAAEVYSLLPQPMDQEDPHNAHFFE